MSEHHNINYIEIPATDIEETKRFFTEVFGWSFQDYGPEYTSFSGHGPAGGFYKGDLQARTDRGSVLVVLYSENLEATLAAVKVSGGTILKPIFSFPGGRRFHFIDPSGNEFAVWSE
ncbi:MAG: VOC family protein [Xanthomonadales bacterium]|nr:VOC family protein [Xanthomonadales bacterium]